VILAFYYFYGAKEEKEGFAMRSPFCDFCKTFFESRRKSRNEGNFASPCEALLFLLGSVEN
jgi:hypothetical protein